MNILITGGLGFIGRALVLRLLAAGGNQIVIVDKLSEQIHGPTVDHSDITSRPEVRFIREDICTPGVFNDALDGIDLVYHLAAETGTGQSMYEILNYYRTNVLGTAALMEEIVRNPQLRPKHVILSSSRSVYGEGAYVLKDEVGIDAAQRYYPDARSIEDLQQGRFDFQIDGRHLAPVATRETDLAAPKSAYAASKLAQEHLAQIACGSVGVGFTALRFQNVYGPGQSLRNPYTGIISIFINILRQGGTVDIFEDGEESRDFIFIDDIVTALQLAPKRAVGVTDVINVGHGTSTSVSHLVRLLQEELGVQGRAKVSGRFRPGDIRHCFADTTRLRHVLGLYEMTSLQDGLSQTVKWALTQPVEQDRSEKANRELDAFLNVKS